MKRIFIVLSVSALAVSCDRKGGGSSAELKTMADSAGYALGVDLTSSLQEQKLGSLNFGLISYGIEKVLTTNELPMTLQECSMVLTRYSIDKRADTSGKSVKGGMDMKMEKDAPVLANLEDSASYALGINVGSTLKMNGMTDLNRDLMKQAMRDVLADDSLALKPSQAFAYMNDYMRAKSEAKSKKVVEEGEAFLAENAKRPEVKTTASGLQYEVIKEGNGPKPGINDVFVANYRGTLIDGTEFDASREGQPLVMGVNQVIPGWIEGLQLMPKGSKYKFYIPYKLGYGMQGNPPQIPGGAVLLFDLELVDIKKGEAAQVR
jgi:FKBP-type peptidyl-prolyl cis-trans isomerase FklB